MMKTAEEFYEEILGSKELQEELKAVSEETLGAFLKKHGCEADEKEFQAVVRAECEGEIEDAAAENISGGWGIWFSSHSAVDQRLLDAEKAKFV